MEIDIQEIVKRVIEDKDFRKNFEKNPTKCLETILGKDLPDEKIDKIIKMVKEKAGIDSVSDLAGIAGKLGSMFGKDD